MTRGEVWWAELAGDAGFRPVVIVCRTEAIERRQNLIIAEVTREIRSFPSEVLLTPAESLPTRCVINTDALHTIPKDRLRQRMTNLTTERLFALDRSLAYSLGLDQ